MNILQYEALVKTLEYGTLSRAAEEMGAVRANPTKAATAMPIQMG